MHLLLHLVHRRCKDAKHNAQCTLSCASSLPLRGTQQTLTPCKCTESAQQVHSKCTASAQQVHYAQDAKDTRCTPSTCIFVLAVHSAPTVQRCKEDACTPCKVGVKHSQCTVGTKALHRRCKAKKKMQKRCMK